MAELVDADASYSTTPAVDERDHERSLLTAAEAYAARGWHVLPLWWPNRRQDCSCGRSDCASPAKHPIGDLTPHGLTDAMADPAGLRQWWTARPAASVGIRTGAASGLLVLDVDGGAGVNSIRQLASEHGPLGAAWVQTGSGGWHAYLAHPGDIEIRNSAGKLGAGLDVRGDGGYVVAPPSRHVSGGQYNWRHGRELKAAPGWLIALLTAPPSPAPPLPRRPLPSRLSNYVITAIEREAAAVADATEGRRNHQLNIAAYNLGRLVGAGMVPEHTVTSVLLQAARAARLNERETAATIRSGLAAGQRRPREVAS